MTVSDWLDRRTFHHRKFADRDRLIAAKAKAGATIAACIPTLDEAPTIGRIVRILGELRSASLIDEVVVVDSGSEDETLRIAEAAGAAVHRADEVDAGLPPLRGKGENLWKALFVTRSQILCFLDGDVSNFHERFVLGLIGPLLEFQEVRYVKGFYERPHQGANSLTPLAGGRVTEILIRPIFALFFPELCGVVQPLAGEYAARRSLLERLPFPAGYGVEAAHLIDLVRLEGLEALAQVDLEERFHRHHDNAKLGRMSFGILQTVLARTGMTEWTAAMKDFEGEFLWPEAGVGGVVARRESLKEEERPPAISLAAYPR